MSEILDGEITYPRVPHGSDLMGVRDHQTGRVGFMGGTTKTSLLIDKEFFIRDVNECQ